MAFTAIYKNTQTRNAATASAPLVFSSFLVVFSVMIFAFGSSPGWVETVAQWLRGHRNSRHGHRDGKLRERLTLKLLPPGFTGNSRSKNVPFVSTNVFVLVWGCSPLLYLLWSRTRPCMSSPVFKFSFMFSMQWPIKKPPVRRILAELPGVRWLLLLWVFCVYRDRCFLLWWMHVILCVGQIISYSNSRAEVPMSTKARWRETNVTHKHAHTDTHTQCQMLKDLEGSSLFSIFGREDIFTPWQDMWQHLWQEWDDGT